MYISYLKIPEILGIKKGDIILLSSDVSLLMYAAKKNNEEFSMKQLIDAFLKAIGSEGTLLVPVYNWGFCKGEPFNWRETKSETGMLGQYVLSRSDFKRTLHPIYSFAVAGKDKDLLCSITNKDSFGLDSPFAYLHKNKGKNIMLDVPYQYCFTFSHYVEQVSGMVSYRYNKEFTALYTGPDNILQTKTYTMFVRDLDLDVVNTGYEMEKLLIKKGAMQLHVINGIYLRSVDLDEAFHWISKDIKENRSRKICKYKGQDE